MDTKEEDKRFRSLFSSENKVYFAMYLNKRFRQTVIPPSDVVSSYLYGRESMITDIIETLFKDDK